MTARKNGGKKLVLRHINAKREAEMNIIAVDDERAALSALEKAIKEGAPNANLACFSSPRDALEYGQKTPIDVAFLDIDMHEMDGLSLAKSLKDVRGQTNIVFVTAYSQYANSAFKLRASGYVMKPIDPKCVLEELEYLRHPAAPPKTEKVRLQCFGSFAVFLEGQPLMFSRPKTKELLAYLVHKRGAGATSSEIASVLWENREYNKSTQSQTRNIISQLTKFLKEAGIEDILIKSWNSIAIDTRKVSCDFYDALEGDVSALNTYTGEYMSEYSWAEFTIGYLNEKLE